MRRSALVLGLVLSVCSLCTAQAQNLLFYGNSFTIAVGFGSSRSVPDLVRDIAVVAGEPSPFIVNASIAGWSLNQHRASNTNVITTSIAPGQTWDKVILQDFSTRPTQIGNLADHRASYVSLFQAVRNHSPAVNAIGYETWARAPGHSFYTGANPSFPGGPAQMQQQLRDGYALSTGDVNALYGAGTSTVSPVGDAWENANWQSLHAGDLYHAQNRGSLLAALVLYSTIYDDPTLTDINLTGVLGSLGLSVAEGAFLASVAESTVPEPASLAGLAAVGVILMRRRR